MSILNIKGMNDEKYAKYNKCIRSLSEINIKNCSILVLMILLTTSKKKEIS